MNLKQFRTKSVERLTRPVAAVAMLALGATVLAGVVIPGGLPPDREASAPRRVLWAWERPENLTFLAGEGPGVAFLAATLHLQGGTVTVQPRRQPLRVPPETPLMAVVRIESRPGSAASPSEVAAAVAGLAGWPGVMAVQVDYDARVSERTFYRQLLVNLRPRLPEGTTLSITALASWCLGDNWLHGLPIDEAVPMLFRMGPDRGAVLRHLAAGGDFTAPLCRTSLGVSTDEPVRDALPAGRANRWRGRRVYIFHPQSWTAAEAHRAVEEWQ